MKKLQTLVFILGTTASISSFAAEFSFDRPGTGFGTGITPVGKLAWEQGLPSVSYTEANVDGAKERRTPVNGDGLLRTGLTQDLELQLGWQGPFWSQYKRAGVKNETHGLGDISVGLKKAIDLNDDRLTMAVLAQAVIATGNDEFSAHDDIYSLGSTVAYDYSDLLETSISMFYEVQNSNWAVTAVPTLGYKFGGKWSGFSEFVYRKAESQDYEYGLGTGVIYALNDRTQFDASVGVQLNGNDRGYTGGFGVSYLF